MKTIILEEGEYFGTDMASFATTSEGTIITDGYLYSIKESQYLPEEGDITRSQALDIVNVFTDKRN